MAGAQAVPLAFAVIVAPVNVAGLCGAAVLQRHVCLDVTVSVKPLVVAGAQVPDPSRMSAAVHRAGAVTWQMIAEQRPGCLDVTVGAQTTKVRVAEVTSVTSPVATFHDADATGGLFTWCDQVELRAVKRVHLSGLRAA